MPFVTVMLEKFDVAWKRMPPFGCPNEFHGALNVNENVFPPSSSGLRMGMLPGLMPRHDCVALPKFHTSPVAEQVAGTGVAVGLAVGFGVGVGACVGGEDGYGVDGA